MKKWTIALAVYFILTFATACSLAPFISDAETTSEATINASPQILPAMSVIYIYPGEANTRHYLSLVSGGDTDTEIVSDSRRTGNGQPLTSEDGNTIPDSYIQFDIDDSVFFQGVPTSSVLLEVTYLDEGTDTFIVQYDSTTEGGPFGDGRFLETHPVFKTGSGKFKIASFVLKDVYFGNRDNEADIRIADNADGAETIKQVRITLLPVPHIINVDTCGANPWDDQPDSDAIQACINQVVDGDTVTFTSGENTTGYRGYLIDKTIFLSLLSPHSYLTFTSTDPSNPALLQATDTLKGFVVKLYAGSKGINPGEIDYLTLSHLHLDGNRDGRTCLGPDGIANGLDDNWGSYLSECSKVDDSWCRPGTLDLPGMEDWNDPDQNYTQHPKRWSTGFLVEDLRITNTECGTAFGMGSAGSVIINTTIETAGDHVHGIGCTTTDDEDGVGDWSDGITFDGPNHLILNNTIVDPSDVGIVFFGGRETIIRGNTVRITSGNHGAFAGIAIHPWGIGDVSFGQVTGNTVTSEGSETCGGLHAGINLGPHMWGEGCLNDALSISIGTSGCINEPVPPKGAFCPSGVTCQLWASIAADATYMLTDNTVSGAHVNYVIEGVDDLGTLIESGNISSIPRWSDWYGAAVGCTGVTWGPTDRVAHHPSLPGWTDIRIHCP